jgi:two-component system, response regulator / RNA-binding antiterminator
MVRIKRISRKFAHPARSQILIDVRLTLQCRVAKNKLLHCTICKHAQKDDMETKPLSVLIVDENVARAAIIEAGVREAGHSNVTVIYDVSGLARRIAVIAPDIIVIDIENPNRDMLESLFQISRAVNRPIAMFVDRSDLASMEAAIEAGVSAYVVDGLRQERIKPILEMAISRFKAYSRMVRELEDARSELEGRKIIDRAKAILMKSKGITENEAHTLLRKTAMNQNRKMSELAQSLVLAASLLE